MERATPDDPHDRFLSHRLSERMEFGELLIKKRDERGLKRSQMAKEIGVHPAQISRWEEEGATPKDNFIWDLAAWSYRLNEKEKARWRSLSGLSSDPRVEYGNVVTFIESQTVEIQKLVHIDQTRQYTEPLRHHSRFDEVHTLWNRLRPLVLNLPNVEKENKQLFLPQCLLIELAGSISHCMDTWGEYQDRLVLLTNAARAAKDRGQVIWRGWFLGDGIAWPMLMIYRDRAHIYTIREHLQSARKLAVDDEDNGTNDLYVMTSSFLAMTYLFEKTENPEEAERKLGEAEGYIAQAFDKPCTPVAESRREWAAGEMARYRGEGMGAKSHYERAVKAERQFTNNAYTALVSVLVGIGEIDLEDGNIDGAIKHFNNILTNTPSYCRGPFEKALVEFSIAKVWEKVGDKDATRAHALKAKSILQPMEPRPYLDQEITDLLSRLPR